MAKATMYHNTMVKYHSEKYHGIFAHGTMVEYHGTWYGIKYHGRKYHGTFYAVFRVPQNVFLVKSKFRIYKDLYFPCLSNIGLQYSLLTDSTSLGIFRRLFKQL